MARRDGVRFRLSVMMAGLYAVQGAWWPLLAVHLQDLRIDGRARGAIFATQAIAALITPLFAGQIADRIMPMQRLLALLYALGTGLLVVVGSGQVTGAGPLFGVFLAYWILTAPALSLGNALAFRNLERPTDQFGAVRLWGTVGWMVVGWVVSAAMAWQGTTSSGQGAYEPFWIAALLSAVLSVYCLSLPHTPPLARNQVATNPRRRLDLSEVRELAGRPSVAIFLAISFGVSFTSPYVYQVVPAHLEVRGLPRQWIGAAMSLGQVLEVLGLLALPWLLRRWGIRAVLAFGIAFWSLYYALLAIRWPIPWGLIGLPVQGLAIAFFQIAGPIYLDRQTPASLRGSAQGLYLMCTTGLGVLLGSLLAGDLASRAASDSALIFLFPLVVDLLLLVALLLAFRSLAGEDSSEARPVLAPAARAQTLAPGSGQGE